MPDFTAYGPSHWAVLLVTAAGAAGWIRHGRRTDSPIGGRVLAIGILALNIGIEVVRLVQAARFAQALPLQLSDLAPYASGYALWSGRGWACALCFYWGLTLSTQALLTPVLSGPDFPSAQFLAFFAIHVLVIWAAIYLAWGRRRRPSWPGYRFTVAASVCWAAAMLAVNAAAGTNYGFVSAKPSTPSLLDLLGPWPWYLLPETALALTAWALLTVLGRASVRAPGPELRSAE